MVFPDLLDPQNKKEIALRVFFGHFFFLNDLFISSEQKVRAILILGGTGYFDLPKMVNLDLQNTHFFPILDQHLFLRGCNFRLWALIDLIPSRTERSTSKLSFLPHRGLQKWVFGKSTQKNAPKMAKNAIFFENLAIFLGGGEFPGKHLKWL